MSDYLTTAEAAELLGVTVWTIHEWARTGKLDPIHKGPGRTSGYTFKVADVEALAAERNPEAVA